MDGRGRAHDNIFIARLWRTVEYEEVYLNEYETVKDAASGIEKYFNFYKMKDLTKLWNIKLLLRFIKMAVMRQILLTIR